MFGLFAGLTLLTGLAVRLGGTEILTGNIIGQIQYTRGGDDRIYGDAGFDYLYGGAGSDLIKGGDGNGRISRTEAENMMNSPSLKSELFNASIEEQGRFYNALENSIRVRLLKLSRAYNTPRWSMAVEMCERNGLSAIDAERIALAMRANASLNTSSSKAKSVNDGTPIIADLDGNGHISRSEAENMMNSPSLKSELFNASVEDQSRFYNALENNIRVRLLKLARAYGTPRWTLAIEMCERNGLSAQDAERIAIAMQKK